MRVYVAGPWASRDGVAGEVAAALVGAGHTVMSTWLGELPGNHAVEFAGAAPALDDTTVGGHAARDFEEIDASQVVVLVTAAAAGCEGGGGRHVETGYALARGRRVVVLGAPENVFHRLPQVIRCASVDEVLAVLAGLGRWDD